MLLKRGVNPDPNSHQDQLLPTLKNLLQDRAASVRQQLVLTLGTILAHPPPAPKAPTPKEEAGSDDPAQRGLSSFEPRLLALLLPTLSDFFSAHPCSPFLTLDWHLFLFFYLFVAEYPARAFKIFCRKLQSIT